MNIAVIGDKAVVGVFAAVGFEVFPFTREYKVRETIKDLAAKNYPLILVTRDCLVNLDDFLAGFADQPYPIILPIPTAVKERA